MQAPKAFHSFCRQLHQDVFLIHGENFVEACIEALSPKERAELKAYVERLLETSTNAELKGILRRSVKDHFFTSESARALFDAMADRLRK